ncbi:hypothetical protein BROUX41_000645 [Berkeleyomyces rouxiae]|uniref:uncharacterized protein n=1 Tax=Berkeleyomyces rouxiae TaxID=2035830 RepID=UPI003B7B36BC
MQYSTFTLLAALVGNVLAQTAGFNAITAPTRDQVLTAGSSFAIQWTPDATYNADTVSIQLLAGTSNTTLQVAPGAIASSISSAAGEYLWAIPSSLEQANTYGFKLVLDKDNSIFQYSNPFSITFGEGSTSSQEATYGETEATTSTTTSSSATTSEPAYGEPESSAPAEETTTSAASSTTTTSEPVYGEPESSAPAEETTTTTPTAPTTAPSYNNGTDAQPTTLIPVGTGTAAPSGTGAVTGPSNPITAGAGSVGAPLALLAGVAALML